MEKTLFSRYKDMINLMLSDGQTKYTANELNTFVGRYESVTGWKRCSNNIYYTTRSYQSLLRRLGCITKIKRGLWQINAPIPEWFTARHLNALVYPSLTLPDLEANSTHWQSLPAEHKVNPFKQV
jgi:hypothetical protein